MSEAQSPRVLIVDDNRIYREAFRRNLLLNDYVVYEAADGEEAMTIVRDETPDVVVTDLQMRTDREGLDLIKELKRSSPLTPVIMISAVGTFEEGAEAMELGAVQVIHKSRIDEEIDTLYDAIDRGTVRHQENRTTLAWVGEMAVKGAEEITSDEAAKLREVLVDDNAMPHLKGEAFEVLASHEAAALRQASEAQASGAEGVDIAEVERSLSEELPGFAQLNQESRDALRAAEMLFRQESLAPAGVNFARSIGFSFCFAVENEAKARLRRRINKALSGKEIYKVIPQLMDQRKNQLDIFYHQHILQIQRQRPMDFTVDNVRQTFMRIMEHKGRYKPDGLKAIGIMLLVFGRAHSFTGMKGQVDVPDLVKLRELESEEVIELAEILIALQHLRNPYIHPEISEMEKVSELRKHAIKCLTAVTKLAS